MPKFRKKSAVYHTKEQAKAVADLLNAHMPERGDPPTPATEAAALVAERTGTHGKFTEVGAVCQAVKDEFRRQRSWSQMTPMQREFVDMVVHKLARMTCGDPTHEDHVKDIGGYAEVTLKFMREGKL